MASEAGQSSVQGVDSHDDDFHRQFRDANTSPARLLSIWNSRFQEESLWRRATEQIYEGLARRMLEASAPLIALEVADAGLERWPGHLMLRQVKGLALA